MKKYFFYFLLTAFVFNLLFLNNFTLAQRENISEIFIGVTDDKDVIDSVVKSGGNIKDVKDVINNRKLCYDCIYTQYGIICQFVEEPRPDTADYGEEILCCHLAGGKITHVTPAEDCPVGGVGGCKWYQVSCHLEEFSINLWKNIKTIVANLIVGIFGMMINVMLFVGWAILVLPLLVASWIIDHVSNLNPFQDGNAPAEALWNALKTWGYIILTFTGLYAGFQWLFGEDAKAKRLIFNILLVALLINFTFLFVKEAFNIVWQIEKGVSGGKVGKIFRDTASSTSPWSLATALGVSSSMPGKVNLERNFINDFVTNLKKYIAETFREILSKKSIFDKVMKTLIASSLSVIFTSNILLITVITMSLYVVRYLIITFLAAISLIAVASMALPEIRIANKSFSLNFFSQWFSYFVRWVLVIPIFLILFSASYNFFSDFVDRGGFQVGSFPELVQLIFSLMIIVGTFILSIVFAEKLTGAAASLAKNFTIGALAYLGKLAIGKDLKLSGNKAADILEKTGGTIAKSPLPMALRARGVQLQKKAQKLREDIYKESLANRQAVVGYNLERFRQAKTDQEGKEALQNILRLIEREKNPWIRTELIRGLNLSDKEIETILTDKNYTDETRRILSLMGDSKTPREAREKLAKIVKGMPAKKLLLASMNQTLYEMWDTLHPEVQKNFLEAIEDLKKEDLIKEFAKLKKNDWQNLYNLSQLNPNAYKAISESYNKASNNAFVGFIEAVVNNDINTLKNNIQYYPEIFRYLDKDIISPDFAKELLKEGLNRSTPETIDNFYLTWFRLKDQNPQLAKEIQNILRNFSTDPKKSQLLSSDQKTKTKIEGILSVKI